VCGLASVCVGQGGGGGGVCACQHCHIMPCVLIRFDSSCCVAFRSVQALSAGRQCQTLNGKFLLVSHVLRLGFCLPCVPP
jgi:hypothetical protein